MGDGGPLSGAGGARRRAGALALALALAALFLGPLLDPSTRVAPRDFAQFNLPLHAGFARLARFGLPEWNPELWGGQPLLSNPNYAPFYPPTWLVVAFDPAYGLQLSVALHALFAAVGAAKLVAQLGGRASARWLAALAFGGGGWFLGLLHALRILFGIAWLPWLLAGARALACAPPGAPRVRAGLGFAGAVAALGLAGEPVSFLIGIGAAGLALLAGDGARPAAAAHGAAAGLLGLGLAALQLVPGFARLGDTIRAQGLSYDMASRWSMPPARLVEVFFPHFFGEPSRLEQGLYFGWTIHDRQFPYLLVVTPGLLLALLGLAALLARAVPWRRVWIVGAITGLLLALGRHNPLYPYLWHWVPGLSTVRYPEKFFLATVTCLLFAGALAWSRLLDERERGRAGEADLPAALAGATAAVAVSLAATLALEPRLGRWFATAMAPIDPASPVVGAAASYLERQAWLAALLALATAALLVAARRPRVSNRALAAAAVALLALDLWSTGQRLAFRVAADVYLEPPPLARRSLELPGRLWSSAEVAGARELWVRGDRGEFESMRSFVERLDPVSGAIWGVRYALTSDYDLTLTRAARRAGTALDNCWRALDRDLAYRFLGAWSVGKLAIVKDRPTLARELASGTASPEPADLVVNPYYLPEARFVDEAEWFEDAESAERAGVAARWPLEQREFLIGAEPAAPTRFDSQAEVTGYLERGDRLEIRYRAAAPALLVVASTYDVGWSAESGGERRKLFETASGMLALPLPAGEGVVALRYRDPWVRVGAGISAVAALLGALVWSRSRRRSAPPAP